MKALVRFAICTAFLFVAWGIAFSGGVLDPQLQQRMNTGPGPYQVIVTFRDAVHVNYLNQLGVRYVPLTVLPMAGAVLTSGQINQVLDWEVTASVYLNDTLSYFNHDAGEITGAHYVQSALGWKGTGKTIVVLDSGIDATHPDLAFGTKVIENVKIVSDLGLTGATTFIEGVINTDNTSGHGTHVAGTVAGSGIASATDERDPFYYRGVAPEARLVGLGAGETLLILHALVGLDYAIATRERFGTTVITNSWGNSSSQFDPANPINVASYEAYRRGIVVTFAAGNDGPGDNTMSSYAVSPWVIGVAAGTKSGELADFSSRGEAGEQFEQPDITAPGVDISSTRAPGTPVGALGPVVNPNHPEYTLRYHTISGTSMATPFVAGTVALMVQANPQLSPDQIEDILRSTADPMSGHQLHEVGAGYINVRRAVERAISTTGNRLAFLNGDVRWSAQGAFASVEQSDAHIVYDGRWETIADPNASGGTYIRGSTQGRREGRKPLVRMSFFGTTVKFEYPTDQRGGIAEVFIDGVSRGTVNYYSDSPRWGVRSAFGNLANQDHVCEIRGLTGRIFLDKVSLDGRLFPGTTTFTDETEIFTGTMGPSVLGLIETRLVPFQVHDNTVQLSAELGWTGGVDIDLYLLDPNGVEVASSASLDNPESFGYWIQHPGLYSYKLVGYLTVAANYTLSSTQTRAITTTGTSGPVATTSDEEMERTEPRSLALFQNYPNPFNPRTMIGYRVPTTSHVVLKVYNILGQEVAVLVDEVQSAGRHEAVLDASHLTSGMYLYRLTIAGTVLTRRMVVLK